MPEADFFRRFGMLVVRDFLDPELCAQMRAEVRDAGRTLATVRTQGADYAVDESIRRTKWADVSAATLSLVETRLLALKPTVEAHFGLPLSGIRAPQFLVYREGDFFVAHRDSSDDPSAPTTATERRASIVVFLNGETDEPSPDSYGGGRLTFYGVMPGEAGQKLGFPLIGEAGLLVAFRPETVHEVTQVTHGERYTIVSWFE